MKKHKSRFEVVLEISNKAHQISREAREQEAFEEKEEPIKKINHAKPHRNFSLEAYEDYVKETEADSE